MSTLAAIAGSPNLTGEATEILEGLFPDSSAGARASFSCERFDAWVRKGVEPAMKRFVHAREDEVEASGFGLLLASSDLADERLYAAGSDGVPFRVDRGPGYGCVGREDAVSSALRFSQFRTEQLTPKRAARLIAFTILAVSMVDSRVGREPEIFLTVGGLARPWNNDALMGTKERIHGWDDDLERYRSWLELGVTDFGTAALDSLMHRRPFGEPADVFGSGGSQRPMNYPHQVT
jgi:hypothetical protein